MISTSIYGSLFTCPSNMSSIIACECQQSLRNESQFTGKSAVYRSLYLALGNMHVDCANTLFDECSAEIEVLRPWDSGLLQYCYDNLKYRKHAFFSLLERGFELPHDKLDHAMQEASIPRGLDIIASRYPDVVFPDTMLERIYRTPMGDISNKIRLYTTLFAPSPKRDYMLQQARDSVRVA